MSEEKVNNDNKGWLSITEACEYLQISEQTMFRWMRDGRISYYKVGKSTRFRRDDLDMAVEKVVGKSEGEVMAERCGVCGNSRLVEGTLASLGDVVFRPEKTKFWVWEDSSVPVYAKCCASCGHVQLHADLKKLHKVNK